MEAGERGARGNILEVKGVVKAFRQPAGLLKRDGMLVAVDDVSFVMREGEILGLLGESGCGKTTLSRMIMHLIAPTSGKIVLDGEEVQDMSEREFRKRRRHVQMVYQNPFDCLNPAKRVSSLLDEPLRKWHPDLSGEERRARVLSMLEECGLAESCLEKRPTEFSGGQLQRLSIARALLVKPRLLIADEIVSALDVPIQNQILNLLVDMKEQHRFSVLFITHDLSVARKVSDRVMVMSQGKVVGIGAPRDVLDDPDDPYIAQLAQSVFTFTGSA